LWLDRLAGECTSFKHCGIEKQGARGRYSALSGTRGEGFAWTQPKRPKGVWSRSGADGTHVQLAVRKGVENPLLGDLG